MKNLTRGLFLLVVCAMARPAAADEIRLKDGKKLYGVIVAYEDNMFKVKTDFGYVLVEKDKIASIIPTAPPAPKPEPKPAAKKETPPEPAKPAVEPAKTSTGTENAPMPQPSAAVAKETAPANNSASKKGEKTAKNEKPAAKATPAAANPAAAAPPTTKPVEQPATSAATVPVPAVAAPPKEPEPPANREEVQGNTYINYTHSFRIYKAPSWSVIDDARRELPNAIVALGTSSESTLMVIGLEETKDPLETAAAGVERRLRDAYQNYRRLEQKKTQVGGMPAVEYRYRGMAENHDWSGTLVVLTRDKEVFTVLGMTYADTDLIQIQENVIARAIASLDFSAH